jgi:hypothetical protein
MVAPGLKSGSLGGAERWRSGPIRNLVGANVVPERCGLIKLVLRLLQCRNPALGFVAFDMSRQRLMWFAGALAELKNSEL